MRLINSDALEEKKFPVQGITVQNIDTWSAYQLGWNDAIGAVVENEPTVEAEPVKHGKWVHDGYDIPHGVDWMHCSECGNREPYVPAAMTNYCPNCGAKMDAERKEQC